MKQEEKNRKSRERILEYAFDEFAEQGYRSITGYRSGNQNR